MEETVKIKAAGSVSHRRTLTDKYYFPALIAKKTIYK